MEVRMRLTSESPEHTQRLANPPDWMRGVLCLGRWDEYDEVRHDEVAAKLCAGCPMVEQCLAAALMEEGEVSARHRYGVRGGLAPQGRFRLSVSERICGKCGTMGDWGSSGKSLRCLACVRAGSYDPEARAKHARRQADLRRRQRAQRVARKESAA